MLRSILSAFSVVLVFAVAASNLSAAIIFDENLDGSFSTNNLAPTLLGGNPMIPGTPLPIGISSVRGVVERATGIGDVDIFMFNIQAGTRLIEIKISEYQSSDMIAVMALNNANFFPFTPFNFNNTITPTQLQQILGVAQFGTGWVGTTGLSAQDLLQGTGSSLSDANLIGSRVNGFKPFESFGPSDRFNDVGAGIYTVYVQQTGDNTEYQMNFEVVSVPEPSAFLLLGAALAAGVVRRRRR